MPFNIPAPSFLKKGSRLRSSSLSSPLPVTTPPTEQKSSTPSFQAPLSPAFSTPMASLPNGTGRSTSFGRSLDLLTDDNRGQGVNRMLSATPPQQLPRIATFGSSRSPSFNDYLPTKRSSRAFLSEKVRSAPSSLVRQLRSYSNPHSLLSFANFEDPSGVTSPKSAQFPRVSSSQNLAASTKALQETLAPELVPIVSLINAQRLRTYATGSFLVLEQELPKKIWIEVEAKLTGTELAIWRPAEEGDSAVITDDSSVVLGSDEFKPKYINLVDASWEWGGKDAAYDLKVSVDYRESLTLKFVYPGDVYKWLAAIALADFEYTSLNEAFTAVILSSKGTKLLDIHILLTPKKRFPKYEWCQLRLPQISSKWIKVYVALVPAEKKKPGRIEIYSLDKMSKKTLILYVNTVSHVFNVYPEHPNMIDFNLIMKIDGQIYINKAFQHLFVHEQTPASPSRTHSRSASSSSLGGNSLATGSRNVSAASTSSFFVNAPTPTAELASTPLKRSGSLSSSFFKKESANFVSTNHLYLMPDGHPSVPGVETMIRNFIHIIDAFKLYGRPKHLLSEKTDIAGMLFGLPSLPAYKYLSMEDATDIVHGEFKRSYNEMWGPDEWRHHFKTVIHEKQITKGFKGSGNIIKLYKSFDDLELDFMYQADGNPMSPRINFPSSGLNDLGSLSDNDVLTTVIGDYEVTPPISNGSSQSELGAPLEFDHPKTRQTIDNQFLNNSVEYERVSFSPQPFVSSPLRPKV